MSAPKQHTPPFRAEQLGSLLRPEALLKIKHAAHEGKASQADLTAIEDSSIKEIVRTQTELGFRPISDGEYRRHMFWYVPINFLDNTTN